MPALKDVWPSIIHRAAGFSYRNLDIVGSGITVAVADNAATEVTTVTLTAGAAPVTFTAFTKDLGVADRTGYFDITGLSGLTADAPVLVFQSAAQIASKGNARDEPEMDLIDLTGYVVNATTIRCYWNAPSVVVGTYAFVYLVGA